MTRPREVVLQPDSPECLRLREWLAQNQGGWRQSYATNPSGGVFVHAGDLHMQFVDNTAIVFVPRRQSQKNIQEEDYAFLKAAAGI
jgi:hypothetical protein